MRWIYLLLVLAISIFLWGNNFENRNGVSVHKTSHTKLSGRSVSLAFNEILLIDQKGSGICVLRFDRIGEGNVIHYSTKFLPHGSRELNLAMIPAVTGTVYEKYWRTRIGLNNYLVTDIGGDGVIECGAIELGWSSTTWVYHNDRGRIAVARNLSFENGDLRDYRIDWHSKENDS